MGFKNLFWFLRILTLLFSNLIFILISILVSSNLIEPFFSVDCHCNQDRIVSLQCERNSFLWYSGQNSVNIGCKALIWTVWLISLNSSSTHCPLFTPAQAPCRVFVLLRFYISICLRAFAYAFSFSFVSCRFHFLGFHY